MNINKTTILTSLISIILSNCSIPFDDEEDAEVDYATSELAWEGELEKFTITAQSGVRLNDPSKEAGTAYITFPSVSVRNTRWEFGVRLTFNPSANNYARFYLASSSNILSDELNGYFIQIGGAKDNVALYRQDESQLKLLASGRELMKGDNSPKFYVKVECDATGYWTFWTRLETEEEYTKEQQVKDTTFDSSVCCGIYCVYTKSRCNGFTFHHIQLSDDVELVTNPDDTSSGTNTSTGLPNYPEEVSDLLLFNEVMYDNATDGAEYIELYNPADTTVTIPSLKLIRYVSVTADSTHTTTTAILQHPDSNCGLSVPPHGYLCLTKSASAVIAKHSVKDETTILEVAKFPQINNEGGHLAIMTNEEESRLIDKCSYSESMHSSGNSRNQGIALEKKSPELPAKYTANWTSSTDTTGGTPGRANSTK